MNLRIYSGRHANAIKALPGELDVNRFLTDIGIDQAKRMAKQLSGITFDFAFASPAMRSQMTAKIIAPAVPLILVPELYPVGNEDMDTMFNELGYAPLRKYQEHRLS